MDVLDVVLIIIFGLICTGGGLVLSLVHLKEKTGIARKIVSVIVCCVVGAFIGFGGSLFGSILADNIAIKHQNSICQECHQHLDYSDKFCSKCGAERERCALCGSRIESADEFCSNCEAEVKE